MAAINSNRGRYNRKPVAARFWPKVRRGGPDDCWEWAASIGSHGYGVFGVNYAMRLAHRVAWEMANGEIPDGLFVCHRCDNRRCVNVAHMFLGTHSDNMHDCIAKDRNNRGERCGTSKLTDDQVREIRAVYVRGKRQRLASIYGVNRHTIANIVRGRTWAHLL